ncbi:30S ribosomal protein S2 [Candidatus Parcubacteria bacterium]|nr:30S ribosomal protein S2 [Candidatus Parcubacteria bacterium]
MPTKGQNTGLIDELFAAGAHFGFVKARRHPSAIPFIFGQKDKVEIFDLEKTSEELLKALKFIEEKGNENAVLLLVGGKSEAREAVKETGKELGMPFVSGRWIGGTLTNWPEIKKRIAKLEDLTTKRERGELGKYTKKERLLIDREIDKLSLYFSGLSKMIALPKLLVVVDPKKEHIAVSEAKRMNIPVVAIAGTDTNLYDVNYAIPANDASRSSIALILKKIAEAYRTGVSNQKKNEPVPEAK